VFGWVDVAIHVTAQRKTSASVIAARLLLVVVLVSTSASVSEPLLADVQLSSAGCGALLQRDYWGVIAECRVSPVQLMEDLRRRFCEFPPPELVKFSRAGECGKPLEVGDELDIVIHMATACRVRVVARDPHSVTLATLAGHPEAGRITFGAYRHESGQVVFHIRSRSRSGSSAFSAGFAAIGEAMQTNTWVEFVEAIANTYGAGVVGETNAETEHVEPNADDELVTKPTFLAQGSD
jgi:Domain of unknown function (DUF1990)